MMLKAIFTTWLLLAFSAVSGQTTLPAKQLPAKHQQLVVVTASGWSSPTASLQRYEKKEGVWVPVGLKIAVVLGKSGLAWGKGLHVIPEGPEKSEGDGKAPAGIFEFGTAFGYAATPPANSKMPYRQATERDYWVDAVSSPAYNRWVTIPQAKVNDPKAYWSSFERMKRADPLYELGLVVEHNTQPVLPGKGSAIFLHVWRWPGAPTLGCTAMSKQDLIALLAWLDPTKNPLLVQAPAEEIEGLVQLK